MTATTVTTRTASTKREKHTLLAALMSDCETGTSPTELPEEGPPLRRKRGESSPPSGTSSVSEEDILDAWIWDWEGAPLRFGEGDWDWEMEVEVGAAALPGWLCRRRAEFFFGKERSRTHTVQFPVSVCSVLCPETKVCERVSHC